MLTFTLVIRTSVEQQPKYFNHFFFRIQRMGRLEKRHYGLWVVSGNDVRIRRRQKFHRLVHVLQQRFPSRRSSECFFSQTFFTPVNTQRYRVVIVGDRFSFIRTR